jgi:hypothetical protein
MFLNVMAQSTLAHMHTNAGLGKTNGIVGTAAAMAAPWLSQLHASSFFR